MARIPAWKKRMRRRGKRLRPRQAQRAKPWFRPVGSTNRLYRNLVPRTLQIATRRNFNQRLKFVVNQTYQYDPGTIAGTETNGMTFRANSIYDIRPDTYGTPNVFTAQDPQKYGIAMTNLVADGWAEWTTRYQHFSVLGSKIQATFEPYGTGEDQSQPGMCAITLSGVNGTVDATTNSAAINKLPYTQRAHVFGACNQNRGARLYQFYSAKKFEGVKDVLDNQQLRGRFANDNGTAATPGEMSFFDISLSKLNPAIGQQMPKGILTIKVEYIVNCTEPTKTDNVQQPSIIMSTMV